MEGECIVDIVLISLLLVGMIISGMICIIVRDLLKASIALSVMSAMLAILMFLLDAPLAAVFELSVCAGLITVMFISAISMTKVHSKEEAAAMEKKRRRRFVALPILIVVLLTVVLFALWTRLDNLVPYITIPEAQRESVQNFLWQKRQVDLLGQIIIVLAGVTGVLFFFKEGKGEEDAS